MGFVMYEQSSFQDVLGEHIRRAPYLVASLFAHFVIALMIAGIMILQSKEESPPPLIVAAPPPPPPEVEDPVDPIIPEQIPEPTDEPVVIETSEVVAEQAVEELGDPDQPSDDPFEEKFTGDAIGLGGPPGGKFGLRGGEKGGGGPSPTDGAVLHALKWLADHQSPEGFWDADGFMYSDIHDDKPPSTGEGNPVNDVGLSGLALLALQGNGNTQATGRFKRNVGDGVNWMRQAQRNDGLFGEPAGNSTLYNHAIATMAMGEAYYFSNKSPVLLPTMKKAVQVIHRARNDYGAWRYDLEANGDNDSSITGWMVFALKTAEENDLPVDHSAYGGAESWFASIEDKNTGRTGYTWGAGGGGVGSGPSRLPEYLEKFPADRSEALTAVALLSRIFMTDGDSVKRWKDHPQYELLRKQAVDLTSCSASNSIVL